MAKTWLVVGGAVLGAGMLYTGINNLTEQFGDAQEARGRVEQSDWRDVGEAIFDVPHGVNITFIDPPGNTEAQPYERSLQAATVAELEIALGVAAMGAAWAGFRKKVS
jgi:hypothetical protein